jgi:hypothetical protein
MLLVAFVMVFVVMVMVVMLWLFKVVSADLQSMGKT